MNVNCFKQTARWRCDAVRRHHFKLGSPPFRVRAGEQCHRRRCVSSDGDKMTLDLVDLPLLFSLESRIHQGGGKTKQEPRWTMKELRKESRAVGGGSNSGKKRWNMMNPQDNWFNEVMSLMSSSTEGWGWIFISWTRSRIHMQFSFNLLEKLIALCNEPIIFALLGHKDSFLKTWSTFLDYIKSSLKTL